MLLVAGIFLEMHRHVRLPRLALGHSNPGSNKSHVIKTAWVLTYFNIDQKEFSQLKPCSQLRIHNMLCSFSPHICYKINFAVCL